MDFGFLLKTFWQHILQLLSPERCVMCRAFCRPDYLLCDACLSLYKRPIPKKLKLSPTEDLFVHSLFEYSENLRHLVLSKFSQDRASFYKSGVFFAKLLQDGHFLKMQDKKLIFVPISIHWTRQLWRGFNQAEVFAKAAAENFGGEYLNILTRVKRTKFQSQLTASEREENLKNAFELDVPSYFAKDYFSGKTIVLCDDLSTGGSTLLSAAKVVKKLKPQAICAVVICQAV